ncbi:Uncharacterized protein AXF42_Ash007010 [Apostasia shenzhenica]|uniref:Uncharacterized protein n=1 Tax=Apostasia shenzhenica TaxID=1088818 RepID=A0A2I0BET2_9ASPA|nr:Uncharacterized protein AXF42_Ash007010 [Apostasia shenzhenica]
MNSSAEALAKWKPPVPLYRLQGSCVAAPPPPSSSLEIRLFYVRISPCSPDSAPECLILSHPRREMGIALEINGSRIPASSRTSLALRRDRLDCSAGEVTYVSTDSVRVTGAVDFEVCDGDGNLMLCGSLERMEAPWSNGTMEFERHQESSLKDLKTGWTMNCYSAASIAISAFLQPKLGISSPSVEVYVAACYAGFPFILTQTIQASPRKKPARVGALDAIPEDEVTTTSPNRCREISLRRGSFSTDTKGDADQHDPETKGTTHSADPEAWNLEEDGQLSWFNAGVRVGVGISLGMCVGIGIGVGILMGSYQATAGRCKRRFF